MPRKPARLTDEEAVELARQTAIECMQSAMRENKRISYECEFHPKYTGDGRGYKHQINVVTEDWGSRLKAAQDILDRTQGKAATKKEAPKPKTAGRSLDELTDEELEALARGETDSSAAEKAA